MSMPSPVAEPAWFSNLNRIIDQGKFDQAVSSINELLPQANNNAYVCNLLGLVASRINDQKLAEFLYRKGIELDPRLPSLYTNLGNLLAQRGSLEEAVNIYRAGMTQAGYQVELFINLGLTLNYLGRTDEAIHALKNAINMDPNFIEAHLNLGLVYVAQSRYAEAAASFQTILSLNPNNSSAYNGLGLVGHQQGYVTKTEDAYRNALRLNPDDAQGKINLANILLESGRQKESIDLLKEVLKDPTKRDAASNFLMALQYDAATNPSEILDWAKRLNPPHQHAYKFNQKVQSARLKAVDKPILGLLSADLKAHPVGWFLRSVIPELKKRFKIIAYANQSSQDFITADLRSHVDAWNIVLGISDEQLAHKIREDRVDILVDLSGHTSGNRLGVFALRAAPIQVSWLGYFSTTGVPEMDYILMDKEHVPEDNQTFFSEKVIYLDPIRLCYSAPAYAPSVSDSPALLNKYITFGSFNNSSKINVFTIEMWSRLLVKMPNSRLILKWKTFSDFGMRQRIRKIFTEHGVEPGRIQFSGSSSHDVMLAEYSEIDIALDPYPFTGATTTCEAMWMGVPVVTLRGAKPVSRQSSAMLKALSLDHLIADSVEEYVASAMKLASDIQALNQLRHSLRHQLADSYLLDPVRFSKSLVEAFELMIHDYTSCE